MIKLCSVLGSTNTSWLSGICLIWLAVQVNNSGSAYKVIHAHAKVWRQIVTKFLTLRLEMTSLKVQKERLRTRDVRKDEIVTCRLSMYLAAGTAQQKAAKCSTVTCSLFFCSPTKKKKMLLTRSPYIKPSIHWSMSQNVGKVGYC